MLEKLKNLKKVSRNYEKKMKKLDKQFARLDEITSSLQGTLQDNRRYSYGK
jgi:peptidoglycan hydrolase CwlO-like protein